MKSARMRSAALLLTAAFLLTGCGDTLYVLSPEEESAVISYASHVVAKYNTYQQDGEIFVRQDMLDEAEEPEMEQPQGETEAAGEPDVSEPEQPSSELPETEEGTESEESGVKLPEDTVTIPEILQLGAVTADFRDSSLCDAYEKSDSYVVDAAPGQQLLVLDFQLANAQDQDVHLDVLAMKPTFQVMVNGTEAAAAQTTILPNDLSTYQGDLLAGESAEAVLLFQIPQEIAEITDLELIITVDGEAHTVSL